jgi:chromodomain-helicase-DNA-binding protein 7
MQKQFYRAVYEKNTSFSLQGRQGQQPTLLMKMMELHQVLQPPYLLRGCEEKHIMQDIEPLSPLQDDLMVRIWCKIPNGAKNN